MKNFRPKIGQDASFAPTLNEHKVSFELVLYTFLNFSSAISHSCINSLRGGGGMFTPEYFEKGFQAMSWRWQKIGKN